MKSVYLMHHQTIQLDKCNVMWQQIWRKSVGKSLMPPKIHSPLQIHEVSQVVISGKKLDQKDEAD